MTALNTILEYGFPKESAAFNSKPFVEQLKARGFTVTERDGRIVVEGNTYQVRDKLKENGFKWDSDSKEWYTETSNKPKPDGKGKMVKPKAESTTKTRSLEDIMADIDRANEEFEKAGRENDPSFEQKKEALAKLHSEYDKALAEKNKARQGFIDAIERQADKNVESNSKAGELGADGKPKPIDEATKSDLKTHYVFQAFEEGISDSGKLSSKEGVGEVFDMFKKLVEKYNPARDENGTISMQSVRRAAWMIESSDFATKEQKAFAHKYGEKFRTSTDKPVPDGKGKMVKPKAAESDYGITMSEEPSVDGDGVRYVVKDGPGDAHRMMFNSKAEAEARLGELRAERKAIQESPSATLADGKKVRLLKTDEGWVPYDENYNDLRHGMFKAAKTKAKAVEVAEKGVKWARDVAEENARLKAESAKPKPDGKGKMVKPEPAATTPVESNETQTSYTPSKEIVEAKSRIEAMPTMTERQKSAKKKAQKDWLLSSIDDAINSHGEGKPDVAKFVDDYEKLLRSRDATWDREKRLKIFEQIDKAAETFKKGDLIAFDVPDDGKFKVYNNPEALELFKRRVQKRLSPTSLKEGTISKAEKPLAEDVKDLGIGEKVEDGKPSSKPDGKGKKSERLEARALDEDIPTTDEKSKLQKIEPVEAKSPEQEIEERLDLKRLDPKRRSDPKVLAWAKKNGRNVTNGMATPDAVRAYDEAMTEATAKKARRWFPDMKIVAHKFGETIKRGVHVIDLRDTSGGVLGWFDPKSKEVHLLPGADPQTVAHEIMWHGTRQYMTDLAAKGDARAQKFLDMMHDVEQNAPQAIKDLVNRIYARGGKAISRDTLLNEYGAWFTMGKGGEALEQALQKAENRNWFARGLYTVKEMVKDFLTAHGRNRVDLSAIDGMTRDEFVDFLAKEFSGGKTLGNIKGKQPPTLSTKETALQRYKRRFYDQNAAVRDLERDIEKKTGKKISADDSVEAANALKYGLKEAANRATQGKMREFRKVLFETGISPADLEYYAALKAAAGRDAKIDARNIAKLTADLRSQGASAQDIADAVANYKSSNGSHIDPREAKMMLNEIENGPDAAKFKKAYDAIRPIIDATLDTQVKAGLVGATEAAQWRTEEPYYIPFKNEYDAETGEWAGRGMSRNYAKPEHYTAKGRQSAAGDILAHIFMDHQAAKLRAVENGVRQKLANLVRANPELGKVEVLGDNEAGIEANNPNVVVFKQGGRAYKITLEGTRGEAIANAFTQRNQLKMGWADRKFMGISMRGFARATAGMATRYSPTFAVRNTTKDNIELANIVYSERGPIEGSKFMGRYIASRAQMAGTLAKYITTGKIDTTNAHGKILDRYIKAGGLIAGGTRAEAFDSIKKSLTPEAIAKEMRRGNSKTRAVAKHVLNSIGYLNEYAEMATRVGIFDAEIKAGKSDAEAALFARRATVDFNRHGDWTPAFNMFRLFSNSTLGASARAAAALTKSKYGAAAMGALFVNGLARAFIDHFVNADEDERRRKTGEATGKDISEYERRTSLFYFRNGDKLYKVAEHESPFSLVSYAGDCVGRWICGDLDGKQVAKNLGVTTAEVAYNFLPMGSINLTAQNGGFAEDAKSALISGVVPTAAQPIAELWANIDYAGRTIYNDPGHDNKTPRAEQGRDSTPDWAKEAAVKLNESTRSEGSRKGYVDIPPEAIQKLVEGYGKNALRDVSMAVSIGEAIIKGDFSKYDPRNTPVRRDFERPLDGNDKRFIAARKEFEANLDYFKKTEMTEDERDDYLAKFPHIRGKRGSDLLAAIKKFRKMERGFVVRDGKFVPHEWPQEKLDEFKKNRRALQAQFLELMGDK